MEKLFNNLYLAFLFSLIPVLFFGQGFENESSIYSWFDGMIGKTNSGIFVGTEYVEHYRMLNEEHKFFDNPNFVNGSVIYDGQPYFDLELKYDLFEDQLLLRYSDQPNSPTLILDKQKVSGFTIKGHQFKNLPLNSTSDSNPYGFLEVLLSNDSIILYEKHHKKIRTRMNDKIQFYEFKERNSYFVFYKGNYYQIDRKRSLASIFPNYKVDLKAIENRYKKIRKDNPGTYLKSVLEDLFNYMVRLNSTEQ